MCLARAIVTAHANINKTKWTASQLKDGFNKSRVLQGTQASKLHEEAGVPVTDYGNTLEDVDTFAQHLGVQINIVNTEYFNEIIYTANTGANEIIYLNKDKNHYNVITSMPDFLGKDYYCHTCKKSYTQRNKQRCPLKCLSCFKTEHHTGDKITCDKCNRTFFGKNCFDEHLRDRFKGGERNVVCGLVQKCTECHRTVGDLKKYECGYATCSSSKSYCNPKTHKCYMLPVEAKGGACTRDTPCTGPKNDWCLCCKTRTTKCVFNDLETQKETGTHVVNYVNAQDFEGNEFAFDTIDEFCKFVFSKQHEGSRSSLITPKVSMR